MHACMQLVEDVGWLDGQARLGERFKDKCTQFSCLDHAGHILHVVLGGLSACMQSAGFRHAPHMRCMMLCQPTTSGLI
jgi:hypothetical protein